MSFDDLPIPLEKFVEYLNFLIDFATNPVKTLQPYEGLGEIDLQLVIFVVIGTMVAVVITYTARKSNVMPDKDDVKELFGPIGSRLFFCNLDFKYIPFVSLLLIFVVSVILHGAAKIGMAFWQIFLHTQHGYLGGSIYDSINALFAFAAFFIPLYVTIIWISGMLLKQYRKFALDISLVFSILIFVILNAYFLSALSATHPNTSFWQALNAVYSPIIPGLLLIYLLYLVYDRLKKE